MVALKRDTDSDEYKCNIVTIALDEVANIEKTVPLNWINAEHNNVTQEYIRYALPLIGGERHIKTKNGLPIYANLKKIYVK
jgi:6-phosphofructokinase 1